MIEIPLEIEGAAYVSLSCNVGNTSVSFRLMWNERDSSWYCDFESVNGKNNGVRVVENSLLLRSKNRVAPEGDFAVIKSETSSTEVLGFTTLGTMYKLYFIPSEEMGYFEGVLL